MSSIYVQPSDLVAYMPHIDFLHWDDDEVADDGGGQWTTVLRIYMRIWNLNVDYNLIKQTHLNNLKWLQHAVKCYVADSITLNRMSSMKLIYKSI